MVRRYEALAFIIIMIITGSVGLTSKDASIFYGAYPKQRYPYAVALTFDDGPYPGYTEKLLKILENENVKATFFLIGRHASEYPDLVRKISEKNHEIGAHTYTHQNIRKMSEKSLLAELEMTKRAIEKCSKKRVYLFRPPGGQLNKRALDTVRGAGYVTVLWTVLPKDHEPGIMRDDIIRTALRDTSDSGIILLHMGRQRTLDALPRIIWGLRMKGYRFTTVSELMIDGERRARVSLR
jgi:peptidoglycan/xylan/chitin deacetylase (PgdA/CDA1 family)